MKSLKAIINIFKTSEEKSNEKDEKMALFEGKKLH
jgi:hypothetical protein